LSGTFILTPPTCRLSLTGSSLAGGLPDIPPGALPALERLEFEFYGMASTLPPSWGADPAVLPALQDLSVQLPIEKGLPEEWAAGFRQLTGLAISGPRATMLDDHLSQTVSAARAAQVAAQVAASNRAGAAGTANAGYRLPPEWAAGFPALERLVLEHLGLVGTIPQSWQAGFPQLYGL